MRWQRRIALVVGVGAVLSAASITLPVGADVTEVGQGAASVLINVDVENVGPIETVVTPVNLPSTGGGPFTDSLASFSEPAIFLEAEALATSTEGGNLGTHQGFAVSSAELEEFVLDEIVGAAAVRSECRANGDGTTGSTTLTGGVVNVGGAVTPILGSPAPNTQFAVTDGITVTVNEQIVTHVSGALAQIVVNAIHVRYEEGNATGIVGDVWIAQSICRAAGPDVLVVPDAVVVTPSFTG